MKNNIYTTLYDGRSVISLTKYGVMDKCLFDIEDGEFGQFVSDAINEKNDREKNRLHPKSTIEELKIKFGKNSEELLGLNIAPEYQCQNFGKIQDLLKDKDKLSNDEILIVSLFIEEMRNKISDTRRWGNDWKTLAKKLIDERIGINDLIK